MLFFCSCSSSAFLTALSSRGGKQFLNASSSRSEHYGSSKECSVEAGSFGSTESFCPSLFSSCIRLFKRCRYYQEMRVVQASNSGAQSAQTHSRRGSPGLNCSL